MIEQGKELLLENLLSLREKIFQPDISNEMMKIGRFLKDNCLRKTGPIVTATFAIENTGGQSVLDMEILVPMDKKADLPAEYKYKRVFRLVNAVYARHQGNPTALQNTYDEMLEHIKKNNLQQITAGYNVNINDMLPGMSMDEMIIDVYIGVNPNIL